MPQSFLLFLILGYTLQCPGDPYCRSCIKLDKNGECRSCQYSWFNYKSGICEVPANKIEYCVEYRTSENECKRCEIGWGVGNNGSCFKCSLGCADCQSNGSCIACKNGILPVNNTCSQKHNLCSDPNCEICDVSDICRKCKEGFSIRINSSGLCEKGLTHCYKMRDKNTCLECDYGYYITTQYTCKDFLTPDRPSLLNLVLFIISTFTLCGIGYTAYSHYINRRTRNRRIKPDDEYAAVH